MFIVRLLAFFKRIAFTAHYWHASRRYWLSGLKVATCLVSFAREWHHNPSRTPRWHRRLYMEIASFYAPLHLYAITLHLYPLQIAKNARTDCGLASIDSDAANIAHQMVVDVAEHKVVQARAHVWIPLLGERCHPMLDLVAVTRQTVVVEHAKQQLALPVVYQRSVKIRRGHVARGQAVAVGMDVSQQRLQNTLAQTVGHELHVKWDGARGLAASAIVVGLWIIESLVESRFYRVCPLQQSFPHAEIFRSSSLSGQSHCIICRQ